MNLNSFNTHNQPDYHCTAGLKLAEW